MIALAVLSGLIGLFPGAVLGLAAPALRLLTGSDMSGRARLVLSPQLHAPGYWPLAVAVLLGLAAAFAVWLLRTRAVQGHRRGPAWDCGFGAPPPWLPFGDPATQYGPASFSQPLRRMLGGAILHARERVDMPEPGETRPARLNVTLRDPAQAWLFDPVRRLRHRISILADRMQVLTVRRTLSVMFTVLVLFLICIGVLQQW